MIHFTRFSGFPARRAERVDARHHKPGATPSGGPENLAFVVSKTRFQHDGGGNRPIGVVAPLVRSPRSPGATRLAE